jgi:hypothetical protein
VEEKSGAPLALGVPTFAIVRALRHHEENPTMADLKFGHYRSREISKIPA